ncbi:peroxiredoxin [Brevundimonas sp. S30B]|uniref:peroxiredoxin n=1 Tax=unclassified Brevundimonas TaxID=2622653 RepID=UPI0010721151|nr:MULTISPECIES: peroxiredoxin [unclassified Brevundimonas]QBX38484.1 peroxiredoxin [Brevundimonas sp. MF30-B]TFW02193.1 peroxiredoxin [Brevundimonas sp. S30B]
MDAGTQAPPLDLPTDGGGQFVLADRAGPTVVYFYPKADTPGCTTEGQDFSALMDDFAALGATVIGVSRDPVKKLDRFKAKHDLKVVLGSDEDGSVTEAWGVWVEKQLYGRKYMGIERATFLIDAQGRIARAWRNVKVKGHADEVLAALKGL